MKYKYKLKLRHERSYIVPFIQIDALSSCPSIIISIKHFVWGETKEHRFVWTSDVDAWGCWWCDCWKTSLSEKNRQNRNVNWWQGKLFDVGQPEFSDTLQEGQLKGIRDEWLVDVKKALSEVSLEQSDLRQLIANTTFYIHQEKKVWFIMPKFACIE